MPITIEGVKLYTIPETAELLRVHERTIRNYINEGKLHSRRIGRPIYVSDDHIKEFLKGTK